MSRTPEQPPIVPPIWVHAWPDRGWQATEDGTDATLAIEAHLPSDVKGWLEDNLATLAETHFQLTAQMLDTLQALTALDDGLPLSRDAIGQAMGGKVTAGNLVTRLHSIERRLSESSPVPGYYPASRVRLLVLHRGADCAVGDDGRWRPKSRTARRFFLLTVDHHHGQWRWGLAQRYRRPTNVEAHQDHTVGMAPRLHAIEAAFETHRLVTLIGAAGMGKTRTVEAWALTSQPEHSLHHGGVWFVSLESAQDRIGVLLAVAHAVDIKLGDAADADKLWEHLRLRGRTLLLFDDVEHVFSAFQHILGALLANVAQARVVVASRERLRVPGERPLPIGPLEPDAARELFDHRVPGILPDDDDESQAAVLELLEGHPLLIELAAHRRAHRTSRELLAELNHSLLGTLDDHASLDTTLQWSWSLLDQDERRVLAGASVFAGGFDEEAADAVLDIRTARSSVLHRLTERSLLRRLAGFSAERPRYALHVSTREFARARLRERGDEDTLRDRHARWFSLWSSRLLQNRWQDSKLLGGEVAVAIYPESANLDAAYARLAGSHPAEAVDVGLVRAALLASTGPTRGLPSLLEELDALATDPAQKGAILVQRAWWQWHSVDPTAAAETSRKVLEIGTALDNAELTALGHYGLGAMTEPGTMEDTPHVLKHLDACIALCETHNLLRLEARTRLARGRLLPPEAEANEILRAATINERVGGEGAYATVDVLRCKAFLALGKLSEATELAFRIRTQAHADHGAHSFRYAVACSMLAKAHALSGDFADALVAENVAVSTLRHVGLDAARIYQTLQSAIWALGGDRLPCCIERADEVAALTAGRSPVLHQYAHAIGAAAMAASGDLVAATRAFEAVDSSGMELELSILRPILDVAHGASASSVTLPVLEGVDDAIDARGLRLAVQATLERMA
ncbi:MAG: hypothetical protein KC912_08435 [Proteobacteria bacterium]|nr:hypothetical protein [Pseudomonadota bacterium]